MPTNVSVSVARVKHKKKARRISVKHRQLKAAREQGKKLHESPDAVEVET